MKFAQFHAGLIIEAGPVTVTEQEIVSFATAFDPQWFHVDREAAAGGQFGGLIASGWHTCALAMRLVADAVLSGSESFASPGVKYIRWPNPTRPGDVLRLRAVVIEARRSVRRPQLGVLQWHWQMTNQNHLEVLELEATSLFKLHGSEPAAVARHEPGQGG